MEFKIEKVKIENFRCFEHFETDLWDKTSILAGNEAGKSTFASAIVWCLNGKNIENQNTFVIVPYGKYGLVSPKVELECTIGDKPLTLTRTYLAKFTRDKQFSKYDTVCSVNGIDVGVKKFAEYISDNICDEEVFRILSVPKTFAEDCPKKDKELLWQSQRRLIMSLVDSMGNDYDVALSDTHFAPLEKPLQRYDTVNNYLAFLKKEMSAAEKSIASFESKMEQQSKNIIDCEYKEMGEVQAIVAKVSEALANLENENEEYRKKSQSNKNKELHDKYNSLIDGKNEIEEEYHRNILKFKEKQNEHMSVINGKKAQLQELIARQVEYSNAIEKLKQSKISVKCPTCGRKLSDKAIETKKNEILKRIENGMHYLDSVKKSQLKVKSEIDELTSEYNKLQEPVMNPKLFELNDEITKVTDEMFNIPAVQNMDGYTEKKETLERKASEIAKIANIVQRNIESEKLIAELEEENKENVERYSKLQRATELSKEFISFKCDASEKAINDLFDNVKFELFEKNKSNDDIKETCIIKYNGIKYNDLSLSTKLVANLDIVKAFQKYYNVKVPIFLDNMESVTDTIDVDCQLVKLYVKEETCPKCGGKSGRRNEDGTWTCKSCGNVWKKSLSFVDASKE